MHVIMLVSIILCHIKLAQIILMFNLGKIIQKFCAIDMLLRWFETIPSRFSR